MADSPISSPPPDADRHQTRGAAAAADPLPNAAVPSHPEELQQWADRLIQTQENDRRLLARGMHDELGQLLTALKIELTGLAAVATEPAQVQHIASMKGLIGRTVLSVRRISDELRPLMLDDLGLNAALESLGRTSAERMGIEVTVRHDEEDPPLPADAATALYRVVQEALANVARHAKATDVSIDLRVRGPDVVLTVQDNGVGLPAEALRRDGAWGLRGMRLRAALHGGSLVLDNAPGSGARLQVRLPLQTAEGGA